MKILIIFGSLCFALAVAEKPQENPKEGNPKIVENYSKPKWYQNHEPEHTYTENVRGVIVETKVPVPYTVEKKVPYPVERKVPYQVKVPVPQPYTVEKRVPYHVRELVKVPYYVREPYELIKKVPYEVKVPVPRPYEVKVEVPKPYTVEKKIPYPVKVLVPTPYTVEKKVPYPVKYEVPVPQPYTVEKRIPYEVKVPVERPYTVHVPKPYPVTVEKKVPYPVPRRVPYHVRIPVDRPYPVVVPKHVPYPVKVPVPSPYTVEKPVPYQVEKLVPYHVHVPVNKPFAVYKEVPYPVYKDVHYPVYPEEPKKESGAAQNGTQVSYGGWSNYNPYEYKAGTAKGNGGTQSTVLGGTQKGTTTEKPTEKPIKYSQEINSYPGEGKVPVGSTDGSEKVPENVGANDAKYSQKGFKNTVGTGEGAKTEPQNFGTNNAQNSEQSVALKSGTHQGTNQYQVPQALKLSQEYSSNRVPKQQNLDKGTQNQGTNNVRYSQQIFTYPVDQVPSAIQTQVPTQNNYVPYSIQVPSTNGVAKKEQVTSNGTAYSSSPFTEPKAVNLTSQQGSNVWGTYNGYQGQVLNVVPAPSYGNYQGNAVQNAVPYTEYQNMVPYSALSSSYYQVPSTGTAGKINSGDAQYQVPNSVPQSNQQSAVPSNEGHQSVEGVKQDQAVPNTVSLVPGTQKTMVPIVVENNQPYLVKTLDGTKPSFKNVLYSVYDQLEYPMPQEVQNLEVPQGYPVATQDYSAQSYSGTTQGYSGTAQDYSGTAQGYGAEAYQNGQGYQDYSYEDGYQYTNQGFQFEGVGGEVPSAQNLDGYRFGHGGEVVPGVQGGRTGGEEVVSGGNQVGTKSDGKRVGENRGSEAVSQVQGSGYQQQGAAEGSVGNQLVPSERYQYANGGRIEEEEDPAISYDGWKVMQQ